MADPYPIEFVHVHSSDPKTRRQTLFRFEINQKTTYYIDEWN